MHEHACHICEHVRHLDLLETVVDSLLRYVNHRCHVVRESADHSDDAERCRSELIERYLWEHRELIDDYVRENPDGFSAASLKVASDLASTLYGTLYLESFDDRTVTFLHETGIYQALLPSRSFLAHLSDGPFELRGALVPFQGSIVALPPFIALGTVSPSVFAHLHVGLLEQEAADPVNDAEVFSRRVAAWLAERAKTCVATEPCPVEQLGPGFHRGTLAGLDLQQRMQACADHANQIARESGQCERMAEALRLDVDTFPVTLEEALAILDTDWLSDIALELDDELLPPTLSRQQIIRWICQRITERPSVAHTGLMWCLEEQFDLIGMLLDTNPLPLDDMDPALVQRLFPIIPYVFILREGDASMAWMPPEVSTLITREDYQTAAAVRKRLGEVRAAARMLATMCGIVSVSDVYERYRRVASEPLDRHHFEMALEELQSCDARDDYALWRHMGVDYIVSVEIADESAPARVTRDSFSSCIMDSNATGLPDDPIVVGLSEHDESKFMRKVAECERELERTRISLLSRDRLMAPPSLTSDMLSGRPIDTLMRMERLVALRDFVDAHVPDDQDDYEFADLFVRSIVVSVTLMAESYNDTMDIIRLYHMENCDGTGFSDTLGRLVTNAYNALPRWELNGWSLERRTERVTGKRRFFNEDGTVSIIGDNDPCPCGSGKTYARCCGHLL